MSTSPYRPVRAISPHLRDLVDGAIDPDGRLVFRSAVLAHLAVQSAAWRVRQGEITWEQAGTNGQWTEVPKVTVDGVTWYTLDDGWKWRSVLPVPVPRTEKAGPIKVPAPAPAEAPVVAAVEDVPAPAQPRTRTRAGDRPLLHAVVDRTA